MNPGAGILIHATRRGRALSETIPAAREAWLDSAITGMLGPDDQQTLLKAAAIMNRLADSDPGAGHVSRWSGAPSAALASRALAGPRSR